MTENQAMLLSQGHNSGRETEGPDRWLSRNVFRPQVLLPLLSLDPAFLLASIAAFIRMETVDILR